MADVFVVFVFPFSLNYLMLLILCGYFKILNTFANILNTTKKNVIIYLFYVFVLVFL